MSLRARVIASLLCGASLPAFALSAVNAEEVIQRPPVQFKIKNKNVSEALKAFADQAQIQIMFSEDEITSSRSVSLKGRYDPLDGLALILKNTGLDFVYDGKNSIAVRPQQMIAETGYQKISYNSMAAYEADMMVSDDDERIDEVSDFTFDEIIVTAQKRAQSVKDVPISIVALGAAELEERGIENFEDLGLAVPGMSVVEGGNIRRVFMRGIGNTAGFTSPLIGTYVDFASVGSNPAYVLDLRIYDLERVEVLRGPQGTLYGDGSVGGTVRFITKKPDLDAFSVKADIAASFTKGGAPSQKIQGAVNVPLVEGEMGLRISGTFENSGGWIDQPAVQQKNINDQNVANVRIKGLWQPSDSFEVGLMAIVHRNRSGATSSGEDENGNYIQVHDQATTPSMDDDYEIYSATLSYDLGDLNLFSATNYLNADRFTDQVGSILPLAPDDAYNLHILDNDFLVSTSIFTEEVRLSSDNSAPIQWSVGGFYRKTNVEQTADFRFGLPTGDGTLPASFPFVEEKASEAWAVFGDASFELGDSFEIGAGVRYFEDERELFDGTNTQVVSFDSVSPRIYVNIDVAEDAKVYASVAKGFRSGGNNPLGAEGFGPEKIWTYELGTKAAFFEGRLDAEVALFYSNYDDYQVQGVLPPPAPPLSIISNSGKAEIKGIDWSLTWRVSDALSLSFNGNYVDTEITELLATATAHAIGDPLDAIPDYQVTFTGTYDFDVGDKPASVVVDYGRQGRSQIRNRTYGDYFLSKSDLIDTLNASVSLQWNDNVQLGVFAKNLLDERGFLDPYSINRLASRPRPRTIGVQMGVDF